MGTQGYEYWIPPATIYQFDLKTPPHHWTEDMSSDLLWIPTIIFSLQNHCYWTDHAAKINNVVNVTKLTFDIAKLGEGLPGPSSPQLDSTSGEQSPEYKQINRSYIPAATIPHQHQHWPRLNVVSVCLVLEVTRPRSGEVTRVTSLQPCSHCGWGATVSAITA